MNEEIIDINSIESGRKILDTLQGEMVRITVETDGLFKGTLTYDDFTCLDDIMHKDRFMAPVQFFDGINFMVKRNQKLIRILKIEVYIHKWIIKFSDKKVI